MCSLEIRDTLWDIQGSNGMHKNGDFASVVLYHKKFYIVGALANLRNKNPKCFKPIPSHAPALAKLKFNSISGCTAQLLLKHLEDVFVVIAWIFLWCGCFHVEWLHGWVQGKDLNAAVDGM